MIVMNNIRKLANPMGSNTRNIIMNNVMLRRQFNTTMMATTKTATTTATSTTLPPIVSTVSPLFIQNHHYHQRQLLNTNKFVLKNIPEQQHEEQRWFSTNSTTSEADSSPGFVQKPLEALDMALVRQIKAELMEVDANSDGRYVNSLVWFLRRPQTPTHRKYSRF